jgi:hypothetical protein
MRTVKLLPLLLFLLPLSIEAEVLPCFPCAGVRFEGVGSAPAPDVQTAPASPNDPADFASLLAQAKLEKGSPFFVAWEVPLDGTDPAPAARGITDAGGTPWLSLIFRTPAPLAQNFERLQGELRAATAIASAAPANAWFQVMWRPEGQEGQAPVATEAAFLIKRAAVALTGARSDARVASDALPADPAFLKALYAEDVAAYLEAVVLKPGNLEQALDPAVAAIQEVDPGRPIVLDSAPLPAAPGEILSDSARNAVRGIGLTLFRASEVGPQVVSPLALLARELSGDVSYDAGSNPSGAEEAWTFVRGKDFSLRVIALAPAGASDLTLRFPDPYLRRPSRFPYTFDKVGPPTGEVKGQGLEVRLDNPGRVAVLGLERASAAERGEEGVEEKLSVATERQMPVEEILRRLQAFEDAQDRKLDTYSAMNTTHLRFQPAAGSQTVEATLQGPFFFDDKTGSDWAWETLFVNGVRWRSKTIPEIPLVQPEKAAAMPVQITFTKQYRYRLRGSDTIDGRHAWVVDFAPASEGETGKLYQGSVWVDKQIYARLRTRAVQIGLEGEVISNEETLHYTPINAMGLPGPWSSESYILPLRVVAQQILSVVNATTVVERETLLSEVRVNPPDFEAKRAQVAETDVTMVRDTERGLRYLVKEEGSEERVVKEGFDTNKLFLAGGVFYDDALDFPLPLGGVNYFDFDFRGTGKQVNLFFAGALLTLNAAEPRLFGSKFDLGADLFVLAVPFADNVFRDDEEIFAEEVEQRTGSFGLKLGRPLGNFVKLGLEYDILFLNYGESDDTGEGFVLPSDNQTHSVELSGTFSRAGYGFSIHGGVSRRSEWDPWGFPGSPDFADPKEEFARWGARASKNWYLPRFQKIGAEIDYVSGSDLDRFSKYQFGFFGSTRVHGYQSNRVRAEEAIATHLSYGFEIGELLRLDAVGDVAWATDELSGLDNEMLAGVGLAGTFIGPWQTVVNMDVGVPVAGPDDGFVMYLVFLKLFK